jgi:hypothetical protein
MPISVGRSGLVICGFMWIFDLFLRTHLLILLQSISPRFTHRRLVNKKSRGGTPGVERGMKPVIHSGVHRSHVLHPQRVELPRENRL